VHLCGCGCAATAALTVSRACCTPPATPTHAREVVVMVAATAVSTVSSSRECRTSSASAYYSKYFGMNTNLEKEPWCNLMLTHLHLCSHQSMHRRLQRVLWHEHGRGRRGVPHAGQQPAARRVPHQHHHRWVLVAGAMLVSSLLPAAWPFFPYRFTIYVCWWQRCQV